MREYNVQFEKIYEGVVTVDASSKAEARQIAQENLTNIPGEHNHWADTISVHTYAAVAQNE